MDERPESVAAFVHETMGEVELCPNCFDPTFPGLNFCHGCMAPVGRYAAWLPYEQVWASAWIAWKATWTVGLRPWHAWTAWLLLVMLIGTEVFWLTSLFRFSDNPFAEIFDPYWGAGYSIHLLMLGLQVALAWRIVRNGRRIAAGTHPRQSPDDDNPEWDFAAWDDETGFPVDEDRD